MNETIRKHLKAYCIKNKWDFIGSAADTLDILTTGTPLSDILIEKNKHRRVVLINGMYLSYTYKKPLKESNFNESDYVFDMGSVKEVHPVKKIVGYTVYEDVL